MNSTAANTAHAMSPPSATELCNEIIARVKARPEMWCITHPLHRNRAAHRKFWREVSDDLDIDEHILKKRWKHLKDQYRKEAKRSLEKNLPDEGIAWQYYEAMHFIRDEVMRDREKPAPTSAAESEDESDEQEKAQPPKKVRIVENQNDQNLKLQMIYDGLMETKAAVEEKMKILDDVVRHDPDYMYLISILPTLKQLTDIQKLQLKGKINEWLLEALTTNQYLAECETKYIVTDVQVEMQK